MPAEPAQLEAVGGDAERYDREVRPELMVERSAQLQEPAVEPDVWKIEGLDRREDCESGSRQTRAGRARERVGCVVLGRGADDAKVDHWLRQAAPVQGYIGFAIGRSIWWDALKGFLDGEPRPRRGGADRRELPALRRVYDDAESGARVLQAPPAAARRQARRLRAAAHQLRTGACRFCNNAPSPSARRARTVGCPPPGTRSSSPAVVALVGGHVARGGGGSERRAVERARRARRGR